MKPSRFFFAIVAGCSSIALAGCGATKGISGDDDLDAGGNVDSGSNFDVGSGDGPIIPPGEDATDFDIGSLDSAPPDTSCAATSSAATLLPLDIFVMLDQSGSMKDKTSTGVTKWDATKDALTTFMSDPASAGLGIGIQYFGLGAGGGWLPSGSSCTVADYAKAEVEIAALPGVKAAMVSSLAAHSPTTDTPTAPALQGAIEHAKAWQAAHPTHVVVVAFATDGLPSACSPQDIPSIAAFAATAFGAKPAIRTYVIGVLADADISSGADKNLNQISVAGNGADAFIVKTSADASAAFLAALKKIRGAALACEYLVPTGVGADYKKVNINVTLGGKTSTIPYVGSKDKCDPTTGGWYYDIDPGVGTPTKIEMCDATCKALSADPTGKIDIAVGCATVGPK